MRCPEPCGKIRFSEEYKAQLDAIRIAMADGVVMRYYYSDGCRCFHLTAVKKEGRRTRSGKMVQKLRKYRREEND